MKPEEVIELLKIQREDCTKSVLREDDIDYAIAALEKQIPKKVKNIRFSRDRELAEHNIMEGECPECGETSTGNYMGYYCGCCGVALDWGYED